jgi:hypothetical protein
MNGEFLFVGRTFEEYRRPFGLDPGSLAGRRVLDCPGGSSSFTAVARSLGAEAYAVDPLYGPPAETLTERCRTAVEETVGQLREKRDLFVWDEYGDPETRGCYLRAGLPDLPFPDDAFDLVLSANLLFLYDDRLDERFHRTALRELCRVAREVRVFPLASLDRERSSLVEGLRSVGVTIEFRAVDYEFQPGVSTVLVCSCAGWTPTADERDSQAL